jgi:hypothetical protein
MSYKLPSGIIRYFLWSLKVHCHVVKRFDGENSVILQCWAVSPHRKQMVAGTCCLHLQGESGDKAADSSKTFVLSYQNKRHYTQEYQNLDVHQSSSSGATASLFWSFC